ncbi:hypothetical protein HUK65_01610 [Rhodobacteraceae bacterium 2376]|uniref:Uncharacterized protein n=1 Tax=Rhabdonatronobacter sediminivivens TaxID=2743469 RepID=A0A7Z0HX51_9RHOB|nr:hypothetical protein [Rhabdonatronobacter sediminivivens]NYS23672.1 hypothetical protein [Rhabdonatronobacter sediminivivens]
MLRDLLANLPGDLQRGMRADPRALMTGKLAALAVSAPIIIGLALFTPAGVLGGVAVGAIIQLGLGWAIAGRDMRINR